MTTTTTTTTTITAALPTIHAVGPEIPKDLEGDRYATLKKQIIKPENYETVKASWKRLCEAMEKKADEIHTTGPAYIPEVDFSTIESDNNTIPKESLDLYRERGCLIIRGVIPEEQAVSWKKDTQEYIKAHPGITGVPHTGTPSNWYIHWSKAQVESRSHPRMVQLMKAVSALYDFRDPDALIDMDSQVAYADRLRIRKKGLQVTLPLHLDSSSIERWEDEGYRDVYREVFEGRWEDWNPNVIDRRPDAKQDLYAGLSANGSTCSVFRAFQGWLALSDAKCGEGTIRFLPDLKHAIPYILLRPFFWKDNGEIDVESTKFPGASPGSGQFLANNEALFPHLKQSKSVIGIPYVRPGDFVLWHADLLHEVDKEHSGDKDSSVVYIAHTPLCEYNIETLLDTKQSFLVGEKPRDFAFELKWGPSEATYEDRGKDENVLTDDGKRSLGLLKFDINEEGITPGQREIRRLANKAVFGSEE